MTTLTSTSVLVSGPGGIDGRQTTRANLTPSAKQKIGVGVGAAEKPKQTESVRKPESAVIELRSNVDEKINFKMREKLLRLFLVCLCSETILTSVSGSVSDRKVRRHFYLMPYPIFEDGLKGDQLVFIGRDRLHPPENVGHSRSKRQGNKKVTMGDGIAQR